MKIGILGGGLTGLAIAANLKNHDFEVLEKENECGGLCRSFSEDGFTFDYGGAHIIFSRNEAPVNFMLSVLGDNHVRGRRNNKIYFKGRYVKYPFENGLAGLPKQDIFECLYHYIVNDFPRPRISFKEWIYHTFGKGIAEKYLIPYNEKIWNYPSDRMSFHWVDGRVPKPPMEDVIKSAIGIETEGYTHQLHFYYPKEGGIQSLIRGLEQRIPGERIARNFAVDRVEKINDKWLVGGAAGIREFDRLICTIPIFHLVRCLDTIPGQVAQAVAGLRYNSLLAVMVGLDSDRLPDYTAVYSPDRTFLPNRIAFPGNFSSRNVPAGKSSLVAEITANRGDGVWEDSDEELADHVISGLAEMNLIDPAHVCFTKVMRSPYAYVVYDLDYLSNISAVRRYADELGITLCGRFAEFEYLNMDGCVERGLSLASRLDSMAG